jgi:hypothetical protein
MTVTEKTEKDEASVFAAAAPVTADDLAADEAKTENPEVKTRESGSTTSRAASPSPSGGRPTWHLSLTLGLLIALVGGVVLWLQSPTVALLVVGGLVILVGLALALWYLFGSGINGQRRRTGSSTAGDAGTGGSSRQRRSAANEPRQRAANRETPAANRTQRRHRDQDSDSRPVIPRRPRQRDEPRGGTRPTPQGRTPTGGKTPPGGKPPATSRPPTGDRPSGGKAPGGGNGPRSLLGNGGGKPPRDTTAKPPGPFKRWNRDGYPQTRTIVCGPRNVRRLTKDEDQKLDEGKKPVTVKPLTWRPARGKLPTVKPPRPIKPPKPVKPTSSWRPRRRTTSGEPEWPNVDLDQHGPVIVGKPPRITVPRKATRLPPIYHQHRGEPSWPTDDPDRPSGPVVPTQRDRRGTVTTPDLMNRGAREQHFTHAATVATQAAQAKDEQANRFLSLAGQLDGVEGMEDVREDHLRAAGASAHDAEVRRSMASIYGFLSENGG